MGTGQIVFSTRDGTQFTAAQAASVACALDRAAEAGDVGTTINPFISATQRAAAVDQLRDAAAAESTAGQAEEIRDQQRLVVAASGVKSVSDDGSTAVATVMFTHVSADITPAELAAVRSAVDEQPIDGVAVEFDSALADPGGPPGATEAIGVVIAAIVLFIMLGSTVAAGLPLMAAIVGVAVGAIGVLSRRATLDTRSRSCRKHRPAVTNPRISD